MRRNSIILILFGGVILTALFTATLTDSRLKTVLRRAMLAENRYAETAPLVQIMEPTPLPTPPPPTLIRAIYLTAGTAKDPTRLEHLIALVKKTNLTAMVINVKDDGPQFEQRLTDALARLHQEHIIPIARIVIFKDAAFARQNPQEALTYLGGSFWRDNSGGTWLDPASKSSWAYFVNVARQAADIGFEEINLDYVRFPTDGALSSIRYPVWNGKTPKTDVIASFFKYFNEELKKTHPNIKTSLDIFGYTFLTSSGLNIGQRVEDAALYFDTIAPMVYLSHYAPGNFGFENPAAHPYTVITKTLEKGFAKLPPDFPHQRIRPWLQAFDMGAAYNADMLSAEIRALNELGITEFYLWNPRNVYDRYESALKK